MRFEALEHSVRRRVGLFVLQSALGVAQADSEGQALMVFLNLVSLIQVENLYSFDRLGSGFAHGRDEISGGYILADDHCHITFDGRELGQYCERAIPPEPVSRQSVEGYFKDMYLTLEIKCCAEIRRNLTQPANSTIGEEDASAVPGAKSRMIHTLAAKIWRVNKRF